LRQSQTYCLYLRETTIPPNHLKMLTLHQRSEECFFILKFTFCNGFTSSQIENAIEILIQQKKLTHLLE